MLKLRRVQWKPNWVGREGWSWRLCLCRLYFARSWNEAREKKKPLSAKATLSVIFDPRDLWCGLYWTTERDTLRIYLVVLPMLPLRLHLKRAWGGYVGG